MPRIDAVLVPVVTDLERGLRELGVPFGIVGALVPELLLDARPVRMTRDADVTVVVRSLADFGALKDRLAAFGFARTRLPHRMQHRSDLLPFSESLAPDGRLQLEQGVVFNMGRVRSGCRWHDAGLRVDEEGRGSGPARCSASRSSSLADPLGAAVGAEAQLVLAEVERSGRASAISARRPPARRPMPPLTPTRCCVWPGVARSVRPASRTGSTGSAGACTVSGSDPVTRMSGR
jgi:hypothetical protein